MIGYPIVDKAVVASATTPKKVETPKEEVKAEKKPAPKPTKKSK